MTLLALLLALLLERLATTLLSWREARWLDRYTGWALGDGTPSMVRCVLSLVLPVAPVAAVALALAGTLPGAAWLAFAALVLAFSLGPKDLGMEVREYLDRELAGDAAAAARAAAAIMEHDSAQRRDLRAAAVEDAIFVQTNNRVFGVVLWFVLLGPAGAWLFRVSDLMRRAAIEQRAVAPSCFERLHFLLAWLPARLLALGYALAGSFEDARRSWRERYGDLPGQLLERNDWLLVHVGRGALALPAGQAGGPAEPARGALRLARRALLVWLTVVAIMSLFAWIA